MALIIDALTSVYLAYLPWLIFVVGLLFVILGTTIGRKNRRATVIGLWMTALSAIWLVLQILQQGA